MACWIAGIGGLHAGSHLEFWGRFTFAAGSMMPPTFLAFTRAYPTPSRWPSSNVLALVFGIGVTFSVLSLTTPLIIYNVSFDASGISRRPGALYAVFSVYFVTGWLAALTVFAAKWWRASGIARAQLQYLGAGLILPVAGGMTTNLILPLLTGQSTYWWLGPYFSLPLVAIVGHAIIRHRLMDLRLVIHQGLAYLLVIAITAGSAVGLARLVNFDWTNAIPTIPSDVKIAALVTLLMLSAPIQRIVAYLVDPYLFRGRINYDSALREATQRLGRLMQPAELAQELRQIFTSAFVPEAFAFAARPVEGKDLEQLYAEKVEVRQLLPVILEAIGQSRPKVVVINPMMERGRQRHAHELLSRSGVGIIIALARREELLGFVVLGTRRSGDAYFAKDLSLVEALAQIASIALENSLLYRERIQMLEYSDRLLESLNAAVVAVDVNGKITSFNAAAKMLLGLRDPQRGERLTVLPSEVGWALTFAISDAWLPREVEVSIDHETSGLLPVILSVAVLHDDKHQISGALAIVTDLSTVKALERNQRRIEHFALMARFYAGIAHEIRSPLAAISNFIAMLPDRFGDPEYRDTAARLLPMEVARIVRLADRLRFMAPSEDGKLAAVELTPLLTDIVAIQAPAAQEQGIRITLNCAPDLPKILGDPAQLVQLFVNLIKNAIEAMPNGGTITIDAQLQHPRSNRAAVLVRVIDDGIGIDTAVRNKIFEPFFTTKISGTGLGLPICREIADFHRARLLILPRSDARGTVAQIEFQLALPSFDEPDSRVIAVAKRPQRT
jgi:two-component system, NtrC family, nitrogen regulation sensor histidine kinase GlnL